MGADPRRPKRNATLSGYGPQRCSHRSGCSGGADPRRSPKNSTRRRPRACCSPGCRPLCHPLQLRHLHALPSIKREQDESEGWRRGEDLSRGVVALHAGVCTQVPIAV